MRGALENALAATKGGLPEQPPLTHNAPGMHARSPTAV
jgi:hypothetical protein